MHCALSHGARQECFKSVINSPCWLRARRDPSKEKMKQILPRRVEFWDAVSQNKRKNAKKRKIHCNHISWFFEWTEREPTRERTWWTLWSGTGKMKERAETTQRRKSLGIRHLILHHHSLDFFKNSSRLCCSMAVVGKSFQTFSSLSLSAARWMKKSWDGWEIKRASRQKPSTHYTLHKCWHEMKSQKYSFRCLLVTFIFTPKLSDPEQIVNDYGCVYARFKTLFLLQLLVDQSLRGKGTVKKLHRPPTHTPTKILHRLVETI